MGYKNKLHQRLSQRGTKRNTRHGDWRQTYINCAGMCVASVDGWPCGEVENLELHEAWGENGNKNQTKFQQRLLLCNYHHARIDDNVHQKNFIEGQNNPSKLQDDVQLEIFFAGGLRVWYRKYRLNPRKTGSLVFSGPEVKEVKE